MRQQHDVVERDERGRNLRLVLEHVEAGGQDCVAPKRLDQRPLVDQRAAGDVDQHAVRPEGAEDLAIHDMPGLRAARAP